MPLLDTFKSEQQSLALIFPGKGPFDTHPQGMNGFMEESPASALRALTVPRILWDVEDHASVEYALTMTCGITAALEVEIGVSQVQTDLLSHRLQGLQSLGQEHHIRFMHGSHGDRRKDVAMLVDDGDDFLPLLMFVA